MNSDLAGLRKVLVVGCGGTISYVQARETVGVVPTLTAEQLVSDLPLLSKIAEVDAVTFSSLPSAHMTLDDALRLARFIDVRRTRRNASVALPQWSPWGGSRTAAPFRSSSAEIDCFRK